MNARAFAERLRRTRSSTFGIARIFAVRPDSCGQGYKVEQPTSGKVGSLEWTLVAGRGGGAPNFPGGGNQGGGRAAAPGGGGAGRRARRRRWVPRRRRPWSRRRQHGALHGQEAAKICPGLNGGPMQSCLASNITAVSAACKADLEAAPLEPGDTPSCYRSPICGNRLTGAVGGGKGKVIGNTP